MTKRNSGSVRRRKRSKALRSIWRSTVRAWLLDGQPWDEALGPPPGTPGCFCPAEVLREFGIAPAAAAGETMRGTAAALPSNG